MTCKDWLQIYLYKIYITHRYYNKIMGWEQASRLSSWNLLTALSPSHASKVSSYTVLIVNNKINLVDIWYSSI